VVGAGGLRGTVQVVAHRSRLTNLPARVAAGAFILNSGIGKLKAEKDTHKHLHGFASGTYPFLENIPPEQFGRAVGAAEVTLGGALLMPFVVGDGLAGLALASFAGGLLGLYAKTPGMRQEGSIRPTEDGLPLAKDVWLAGIGASLVMSSIGSRRTRRLEDKAKKARKAARERAKSGD
jgi:hypothetical protein